MKMVILILQHQKIRKLMMIESLKSYKYEDWKIFMILNYANIKNLY